MGLKDGVYRFVGEDGSLGYRKGSLYVLKLSRGRYARVVIRESTGIEVPNGLPCPYGSETAFRANWVEVVPTEGTE